MFKFGASVKIYLVKSSYKLNQGEIINPTLSKVKKTTIPTALKQLLTLTMYAQVFPLFNPCANRNVK